METTFNNVTITIEAPTAKAAYEKLCNLLAASNDVEWATDTYVTSTRAKAQSTERLWSKAT